MNSLKPDRRRLILTSVCLLFVTLLVHGPSLSSPYIVDDWVYVNYAQGVHPTPTIQDLFFHNTFHHYSPIYELSNILLFKLIPDPYGLHVINLVLFIIGSVCLYYLVFMVSRGNGTLALIASVLYCVHPTNAESVIHLTYPAYFLAQVFEFLILILVWQYVPQKKSTVSLALMAGLYAFCLLTVETTILLPLYALFMLYCLNRPHWRRGLVPLTVLGTAAAAFFLIWLIQGGHNASLVQKFQHLGLNPLRYAANLWQLLSWYLLNLIIPMDVVWIYSITPIKSALLVWLALALVGLAATARIIYRLRKEPIALFALATLLTGFILVLPASVNQVMMGMVIEHYWFQFSAIGFFILLAYAMVTVFGKRQKQLYFVFFLVVFFFSLQSLKIHALAQNEVTYVENWLRKCPQNKFLLMTYADLYSIYPDLKIAAEFKDAVNKLPEFYVQNNGFVRARKLLIKQLKEKDLTREEFRRKMSQLNFVRGKIPEADD